MAHRHKPIPERTYDALSLGPVSRNENRMAHGNITRHEECRCGATRKTNINGQHRETSGWYMKDEEEES